MMVMECTHYSLVYYCFMWCGLYYQIEKKINNTEASYQVLRVVFTFSSRYSMTDSLLHIELAARITDIELGFLNSIGVQ